MMLDIIIKGKFQCKPIRFYRVKPNVLGSETYLLYSISSSIRHTCNIHVLSKILMMIYHIIVQTHINPQSKIIEVHQNKKVINYMF